ncbi:EI24 domain-containing protein [Cognatishimia sp. MH4019]|uniref:EI24 domain-containing protein n=1 Tax=Cognatishimia sp. MH4019 TaxID=2854030 RepID=UPI001CD30B7D|nr:EI24 domain-containing protein [Cognatishimia sp. MH4019]
MSSILKALSQLGDPRFRNVLLKGIGLAIVTLFAISAVFLWVVGWIVPDSFTLPWIGTITWIDNVLSWTAVPVVILMSAFLMVPVASAMTGIFLDDVAQAVEDTHYPGLGPARKMPIGEIIGDTLRFLGVIVGANLIALLFYLFLTPFAPLIFWGLNGFLLGREYFQMVAIRRLPKADADRMRKANLGRIWLTGGLMAIPLSIPIVNVLVPVLGAAAFTHLFHSLPASTSARTSPDRAL